MGFVLRVDSYPTAAASPPLQQGIRSVPPVIEAHRIVEPGTISRDNHSKNNLFQYNKSMLSGTPATLTYSAKGVALGLAQMEGGRLLDTYA